jgi:eukaryotic-like serine/threonine-protein kinase
MTLSSSTRLGPYEIRAPLGAGGMGEVYRARDTRLDRTVAIKVLPSHLSGNDEFRQRFEREARAVSSLNHPHICTLYDVGHQDGIDYLVMEFIEGESLADRLAKGALPAEQVLRYAIQIADALDKAHRASIVHRDLKPGNIMLTKSGAKLLDFGLAKLQGSGSGLVSGLTSLPTERHSLTGEGTILGTFQYMAPEQLEGKEADHRSDIFAFGAVVYEMATGKKAFTGKSQASLISAIMASEPPSISTTQPMSPPGLDRVVKTCLAKDPDDRWQTAHDVMLELKWIVEGGSQTGAPAAAPALRKNRERLAWIAAALLGLGLLVSLPFTLAHFGHGPVDVRALRFDVPLPEKATLGSIALSPDGQRLAFVAADSLGKGVLYLRPLDSLNTQPLPGTDGASHPFWSPDSRFIGFFAQGKLKKIEAAGGPPQALCNAPQGRGGTWNRDGVIVFAPNPVDGLYRVSAAGGEPSPLTTPDQSRQETSDRWPQFLPDGRSFLYFTLSGAPATQGIYAGSLDSKETKRLLGTDSSAVYASPGYLLFRREGTLMAQAFDPKKLNLTGEPFSIAEHVGAGPYYTYLTISENGVLAYHSGDPAKTQLVWFDRGGKQLGVIGSPGDYFDPALSPDGKRIAFDSIDPQTSNRDLWVLELTRGTTSRLTVDPAGDWFPVWSPDSSRIVFSSGRGGIYDLYQKAASGAGSDGLLLKSSNSKFPIDWSMDGRFILYDSYDAKSKADIWVLPLEGDRQPFPFLQTEFNEQQARFSPNGKWVAYTSDESGTTQVYVQSFPISGSKWQVSTGGGDQPRWWRDGQELFYLAADGKLMTVAVKAETVFEAGITKPLFEMHSPTVAGIPFQNSYAVTADGQRFLVRSAMEQTTSTAITVLVNWTAELKRQ